MDEIQRPSSNSKFFEDKISTDEIDTERKVDDVALLRLERGLSDKLLPDDATPFRASSTKKSLRIDFNIKPNRTNNDLQVVPLPKLRPQQDKSTFVDSGPRKVKRKVECKNLSEYLNEHERFLKIIEHTRRLRIREQKKLDIQKKRLKEFQDQLANKVTENHRQCQYEKRKQVDSLYRRRTYLRRRIEETQLKESRRPVVPTTLFVSTTPLSSRSPLSEKTTEKLFESSSLPPINQQKSTSNFSTRGSTRESLSRTSIGCQTTKVTYSDVLHVEQQLKQIKKHPRETAETIGKTFEELAIQFVEYSKSSWARF